ncbi:type VI secretion system Vgr family protein [Cupriavidus metallidurans]|uniref:type VI secretion system Vgr family protein n=1 Tax=Cupriavidus metallidurans TaxID=119219 RepID=UPI001CCF3126|nr:type VI secretion system tip protein VgrG [Cupriavidus metallidurans]UBM08125.1 type VI secretion system tip protein VgrG [Cupriavidus metallidurans]
MAEGWNDTAKLVAGRQVYFLEVPGASSAAELSVVSFEAVERLGDPYKVTVQLTHPLELDRAEYLNRNATFVIHAGDDSEPRKFAGWISEFSKTRQTRDFCGYEIVVEPLVSRLKLTQASRIYQQKTAPQIIEAVLRRHDLKGHQFAFNLRRKYPQLGFRMQHQLSDWDYIRLLMEQNGIYCYFAPGKFGEMIVFGDDIDHYIYQPQRTVPYRETAGLESGQETVFSLKTHAKTIPESFRVADYNQNKAWERLTGDANVARKENTYGQSYVFGTHHLDFDEAKWEALLRHEAKYAEQLVYAGESNVLALCPARILRLDLALPDAPNGQVITEVVHTGARDAAYRNTYKAIPSDRRFRLPLDEANWPRISGTLSARITSPGDYKYAYLTQQGQYIVRFDFDFDTWPNGGESVPLWFAKPFAGANQTGFHFPLIDGTYVDVAFRDGNPNKPYILSAQHTSQHPELITNQDRWMSRNVLRTQANNKLRFDDWQGQEGVKLSTEYGGKTQLNLGYLVDHKKKKRGEGFELRTDLKGAVRAGAGLLLSADKQARVNGKQTDTEAATVQFERTQGQADELAAAASVAKAEITDLKAENQWLKHELADLKKAVIALSAPGGIGLATPDRVMVSAGKDVSVATSSGFHVNAMKRFTVSARERISMFAHKLGIKLFAAKGAVQIEAQNDAMSLASEKDLTIQSANGRVIVEAKRELVLKCGGSYLRLTPTGIEDGTPGDRRWKAASFSRQGPASLPAGLPVLPKPEATQCALRESRSGTPFAKLVL